MPWPISLSQVKLARGHCRLASLFVISGYLPYVDTHVWTNTYPTGSTSLSSFTTTPGIANTLIPKQSNAMTNEYPWISNSACNNTYSKLTDYVEKNIRQIMPNISGAMTNSPCHDGCAWEAALSGAFAVSLAFGSLGQTNQQNAPRQSKLEQVQEDHVSIYRLSTMAAALLLWREKKWSSTHMKNWHKHVSIPSFRVWFDAPAKLRIWPSFNAVRPRDTGSLTTLLSGWMPMDMSKPSKRTREGPRSWPTMLCFSFQQLLVGEWITKTMPLGSFGARSQSLWHV